MQNETQFADHLLSTDDLYFIRAGDADDAPVKIGRARDPKARLQKLQVGNHEEMYIWFKLPGRGGEEAEWHTAFAPHRMRGEWFRFSPQMMTASVLARCQFRWQDAVEKEPLS